MITVWCWPIAHVSALSLLLRRVPFCIVVHVTIVKVFLLAHWARWKVNCSCIIDTDLAIFIVSRIAMETGLISGGLTMTISMVGLLGSGLVFGGIWTWVGTWQWHPWSLCLLPCQFVTVFPCGVVVKLHCSDAFFILLSVQCLYLFILGLCCGNGLEDVCLSLGFSLGVGKNCRMRYCHHYLCLGIGNVLPSW